MGLIRAFKPRRKKYATPLIKSKVLAYNRHKAQCKFRNEEFTLTLNKWFDIWHNDSDWFRRGKNSRDLIITRIDHEGAWSDDNCRIAYRSESLDRCWKESVSTRRRHKLRENEVID